MSSNIRLLIQSGPLAGRYYDFDSHDTFIFGRDSRDCHIHLSNDKYISRHHFLLEVNPPSAQIRDLGSKNGTFINGTKYGGRKKGESAQKSSSRVYPALPIYDGDVIQVGKTHFKFTNSAEANLQNDTNNARLANSLILNKLDTVIQQAKVCGQCGIVFFESSEESSESFCSSCRLKTADRFAKVRKILDGNSNGCNDEVTTITGYKLGEIIGQGGMGRVYRAIRLSDGLEVAIKIIKSRIMIESTTRLQFLRECEVLDALNHPNIVRFFDIGIEQSQIYCSMEYCQGNSLADTVKKNDSPLAHSTTAQFMIPLLNAINYAHQKGYVHRDIKPANILIQEKNEQQIPKLADFGLAKNYQNAGFSGMTMTGSFAGTFDFMPREQLTNFKYSDPQSDLWSLCATFYYLLTGYYPRPRKSGEDPIYVILNKEAIPIRQRKTDIPKSIADVIDQGLATYPENRFSSAKEMEYRLRETID